LAFLFYNFFTFYFFLLQQYLFTHDNNDDDYDDGYDDDYGDDDEDNEKKTCR